MSYVNNDEDAYSNGQKARSQLSGGHSALGSKNRRLEKGASTFKETALSIRTRQTPLK
jgi:hypothetical protein